MPWRETLKSHFRNLGKDATTIARNSVTAAQKTARQAMIILSWFLGLTLTIAFATIIIGATFRLSWLIASGFVCIIVVLLFFRNIAEKTLNLLAKLTPDSEDAEKISKRLKFGWGTIASTVSFGLILAFRPYWFTFTYIPIFIMFMFALNAFDKLNETKHIHRWRRRFAGIVSMSFTLFLALIAIALTLPQTRNALNSGWDRFDGWLADQINIFPNQTSSIKEEIQTKIRSSSPPEAETFNFSGNKSGQFVANNIRIENIGILLLDPPNRWYHSKKKMVCESLFQLSITNLASSLVSVSSISIAFLDDELLPRQYTETNYSSILPPGKPHIYSIKLWRYTTPEKLTTITKMQMTIKTSTQETITSVPDHNLAQVYTINFTNLPVKHISNQQS